MSARSLLGLGASAILVESDNFTQVSPVGIRPIGISGDNQPECATSLRMVSYYPLGSAHQRVKPERAGVMGTD
jgi:hypothetical protein